MSILRSQKIIKSYTLFITVLLVISSSIAAAERITVISEVANIRSGPGTKYEILWKVEKYYPAQVIKKTGKWYNFYDFEGDKGWIHQSLVSNIPTLITSKENCNIRSGPGKKYKILFTTEKGVPFRVVKTRGDWINIRHSDGDLGWIHKSLVW